jgi:endonuclease-3 related protein
LIAFDKLQRDLLNAYGPQHWWPGKDAFEIIVGALLVQRTTWRNVETALAGLSHQGLMTPAAMAKAELDTLERCIRSAGFFRSKASRLKRIATVLADEISIEELRQLPGDELRQALLALDGVGPETADSILLYAFERPVVVVDAYLRRLVQRLSGSRAPPSDRDLRLEISAAIDDAPRLNELHALVVAHGKAVCVSDPKCVECPLLPECRTGKKQSNS